MRTEVVVERDSCPSDSFQLSNPYQNGPASSQRCSALYAWFLSALLWVAGERGDDAGLPSVEVLQGHLRGGPLLQPL